MGIWGWNPSSPKSGLIQLRVVVGIRKVQRREGTDFEGLRKGGAGREVLGDGSGGWVRERVV